MNFTKRKLPIFLFAFLLAGIFATKTFSAVVPAAEEIWRSLEKLSPDERNRRVIEGAKKEGMSLNQFITLAVAEKTVRMILEPKANRRTLSAGARARIAEGQRKRWAKQKAQK